MPLMRTPGPQAALAPAAVPASASLDTLLARLAGGDAGERRAAAGALAAHAPADRAQAVAALAQALDTEREPSVSSAILGALAAIGSEESVAVLAGCLRSEDAWLRNAAIEELRAMPAQVAPVMAHLLVDWDRDVRILAVGILDTLRHECVEEWLLQLIDADGDVNVCGAALDVLAEIATDAARGPVARLLARFPDEPYLTFTGGLLLARLEPA